MVGVTVSSPVLPIMRGDGFIEVISFFITVKVDYEDNECKAAPYLAPKGDRGQ